MKTKRSVDSLCTNRDHEKVVRQLVPQTRLLSAPLPFFLKITFSRSHGKNPLVGKDKVTVLTSLGKMHQRRLPPEPESQSPFSAFASPGEDTQH